MAKAKTKAAPKPKGPEAEMKEMKELYKKHLGECSPGMAIQRTARELNLDRWQVRDVVAPSKK